MPAHTGTIEIIPIGDIHVGHVQHDGAQFRNTCDYVKAKPNRYWIYMGDGAENVTPDKGGDFLVDQTAKPTKQFLGLQRAFQPIAHRCLGMVTGNHEWRTMRAAMLDPAEMLAHALGIGDKYVHHGGMFPLILGDQLYKVAFYHGFKHSKANKFIEFDDRLLIHTAADLILMGHTHFLGYEELITLDIKTDIPKKDPRFGKEIARRIYYGRTGCYLRYADYARRVAYRPGRIGSLVITLHAKERRITIDDRILVAC